MWRVVSGYLTGAGVGCGLAAFVFTAVDAGWWALAAAILGLGLVLGDNFVLYESEKNAKREFDLLMALHQEHFETEHPEEDWP